MESIDIERNKIHIPSINLSKKLLREICELFDKEHDKLIDTNENCKLTYKIKSKNKEIESHDSNNFLKYDIPKDLEEIELRFNSKDKRIQVNFTLQLRRYSYFTVQDIDPNWVNGISKRIEDIFGKYRTINDLFHSNLKRLLPFYVIGAVLCAYGLYIRPELDSYFTTFYTTQIISQTALEFGKTTLAGMFGGFMILIAHLFFRWLFPKFETEHTVQVKFRKSILAGTSAIIAGVIGNYIWTILPH